MPIIPLDCPACGANLNVDSNIDNWTCNYCGKPFVVKDAIVNYYIKNDVKIKADTVNIVASDNQITRDFEIECGVLRKYTGSSPNVVIPDNVSVIAHEVFMSSGITNIELPDSVVDIAYDAFTNCLYLKSVTIPEECDISTHAFWDCRSLTINWPKSWDNRELSKMVLAAETRQLGVTIKGYSEKTIPNDTTLTLLYAGYQPNNYMFVRVEDFSLCDPIETLASDLQQKQKELEWLLGKAGIDKKRIETVAIKGQNSTVLALQIKVSTYNYKLLYGWG